MQHPNNIPTLCLNVHAIDIYEYTVALYIEYDAWFACNFAINKGLSVRVFYSSYVVA